MDHSNVFVMMAVICGLVCMIALIMRTGKSAKKGQSEAENIAEEYTIEKEYAKMEISPEIFAIITSVLSEEAGTTPYGLNIVRIRKLSSISEKEHKYD